MAIQAQKQICSSPGACWPAAVADLELLTTAGQGRATLADVIRKSGRCFRKILRSERGSVGQKAVKKRSHAHSGPKRLFSSIHVL